MSRRKRQPETVHRVYGGVRLKCPDGHVLGRVIFQHGDVLLDPALVGVAGPNGETKVKARCAPCEANGVRRDLQASIVRLKPALSALQQDPHSGMVDITVGG